MQKRETSRESKIRAWAKADYLKRRSDTIGQRWIARSMDNRAAKLDRQSRSH